MIKKLVPDVYFKPCTQKPGDELYPNGFFLFNITRMLEYLQSDESDIPISDAQVADFPLYSPTSLNQEHINTVDIEKPIIIAEIAPQRYNVIDGNHRMEKARREGTRHLHCYRVQPEVHTRFITDLNAYHSYIEYWNDKVDELG